MSTTVIASRHGAALYLAPWLPSAVDPAAVREVAAAHGVDLFDAELLRTRLEVVVASGLEPAPAARLASALRQQGLTVRVVNDPSITQSARLSTAVALLLLAAIALGPLVVPALLALVNAAIIGTGGLSLPVVGVPSARPALAVKVLDRLRALGDELPAHVLDPLVDKAEALAREATVNPEGPAIPALRDLLADLEAEGEVQVQSTGRSLRRELAQARRASREVR